MAGSTTSPPAPATTRPGPRADLPREEVEEEILVSDVENPGPTTKRQGTSPRTSRLLSFARDPASRHHRRGAGRRPCAQRMGGISKAMLPGPGSSQTTLGRILTLFEDRFAGCVLVTAAPRRLRGRWRGCRLVFGTACAGDGGSGCRLRAAGRAAGLSAVTTPFAFVCGCDMPSLSGPLIDLMARRARDGHLLVPVVRGRPEPALHAIYPISCLIEVERALDEGVGRCSTSSSGCRSTT